MYFPSEFGPCPDPCDEQMLQNVEDEAKRKAKENADVMCARRGANCVCLGTYETFIKTCVTVEGEVENCAYIAQVVDTGQCRLLL